MRPAIILRAAEKTVAKPRSRKVSQLRTELSLAGLLHHQGWLPPPIGVGRVHRLADEEERHTGT